MANTKISELPAASSANDTDQIPANQAGTTRRLTVTQILARLTSFAWSGITGKPTTLSGYGITDGVATTDSRLSDARTPTPHASTHVGGGSDAIAAATTSVSGLMSATDKTKLNGVAAGATANTGTVTSVGLTMPGVIFNSTVPGSPVTGADTLAPTLKTQVANTVLAGPTTGADAAPTVRALVAGDIPSLDAAKITTGTLGLARGGTNADLSATGGANQILKQTSVGGALSVAVLAAADIPSLDAAKITTGTIDQARLGTGSGGAGTKVLYDDQTYKTLTSGEPALGNPGANGYLLSSTAAGVRSWANLIKSGGGALTLDAASAYTLTVPATGTAALLGTANVFTAIQEVDGNTIGATSTDGLILANTTAAAAGAQQYSPRLRLTGQGWKTNATAASQTVDFAFETQPVQGAANPASNLLIRSQINGGGYTTRLLLDNNGAMQVNEYNFLSGGARIGTISSNLYLYVTAGGATNYAITSTQLRLPSSANIGFSTSNDSSGAGANAGLGRNAAAVIEINNGTAGQWGSLKAGTYDAGTTTITDGLTLGHQSTGTPAAGLGTAIQLNINSSTTAEQNAARMTAEWVDATHASRKARLKLNVYDTATREAFRADADGARANIGLLGASDFGSGSGVIAILNTTTAPSATPSGGGVLYVEAGALKFKGSGGTVTTIAVA